MSRNLIYISHKLDSRVSTYSRLVLDCLLTFGDQAIDCAINIYPSNQTLAERLNTSLIEQSSESKNDLENLGIIVRYYDEAKHREMIKVPFAKLNEYMRDKSVTIEVANRHESVTIEVANRHDQSV